MDIVMYGVQYPPSIYNNVNSDGSSVISESATTSFD